MKKKFRTKTKKFRNSGYSEGGANFSKGNLKLWNPQHLSAKSDIDMNLSTLRARAADLVMNSPLGASAIRTQLTGVINGGLKIFPRINGELLGLSSEEARAWNRKTKREFELWAEDFSCDFYRRNNFYELQRIAFTNQLVDGDAFCLFRRRIPLGDNPYTLRLQLIEAQRVSNPRSSPLISNSQALMPNIEMPGLSNGSRIINGVEVDRNGRLEAFWISNRIWNEFNSITPKLSWSRVNAFGRKSGTKNILHLCYDSRIEQFRGEPYLAPVIETIKSVTRYADAELSAAIIKAFFAIFYVQPASNYYLNQIGLSNVELPNEENLPCLDVNDYKADPGSVMALPRGVDVKAVDNANAQSTFEPFTTQFITQICAGLGLPREVVMKNFNASYSASKAALLMAQDEFRQRRLAFIADFCAPIYENFLTEAVSIGRINAPNFFDDPVKRRLYLQADWRTETSHLLDSVKELSASKMKIELGLSTFAKEAAEICGTDFFDNIQELELERKLFHFESETKDDENSQLEDTQNES